MREKPVKHERVPINKLLEETRKVSEKLKDNKVFLKTCNTGMIIRNMTVYEFYNIFLGLRDAEIERRSTQKWISDCIGAMFEGADTNTLTMRELGNMITGAINSKDLNYDDRWALYELCLMLNAQMGVWDGDALSVEELTTRQGTPYEPEPQSLYNRVIKYQSDKKRNKKDRDIIKSRVSLDQLLGSVDKANIIRGKEMKGLKKEVKQRLPMMHIGWFSRCCLADQYIDDVLQADFEEQILKADSMHQCFLSRVEEYNSVPSLDERTGISVFIRMTIDELNNSTCIWSPVRDSIFKSYEMCYEIINLMADKGSDEGHIPLMDLKEATKTVDDLTREADEIIKA